MDVAGSAPPPALPARVVEPQAAAVRSIPVHRVRVLNPRCRSKKTFAEIVDNIHADARKKNALFQKGSPARLGTTPLGRGPESPLFRPFSPEPGNYANLVPSLRF